MIPALPEASRRVRRRLTPVIRRASRHPGADRYRKHFPAAAHLWLLILHGLSGAPSLRRGYARLASLPGGFARLGLAEGVSFSQLARSSTSRPPGCCEAVLADLVAQARRTAAPNPAWRVLRRVQAIDSTFLRLSVLLSPWCQHGQAAPGVRLHAAYAVGRRIPTDLRLTLPATNDHEALRTWDLEPWRGWTVLIDLGYYGHRQFARLRDAGVSVLSRVHPQASYTVTDHRPVPVKTTPDGDTVLPGMRLIRSRNRAGHEQAFITDRFDLTAFQLVRLYRYRWQIELFFRGRKHQLGMIHPLGRSQAAVWLSVLVAVIIVLVLALVDAIRPTTISAVAWKDAIGLALIILLALPDG